MCEATLNRTRAADLRASARSEGGGGYTGREDAKTRGIPPNFRRQGHRSAATRQVGCSALESQLEETCSIRHRATCLERSRVFSLGARFYPLSDNPSSSLCPVPAPRSYRSCNPQLAHFRDVASADLFRLHGSFRSGDTRRIVKVSSARVARVSLGVIASLASRDLPRERRLRRGIAERSQADALINSIAPESCP